MFTVELTTDIENILTRHRQKRKTLFKGNLSFEKIVYIEKINSVEAAITREQELRNMPDHLTHDLLKLTNPGFKCLSEEVEKISLNVF